MSLAAALGAITAAAEVLVEPVMVEATKATLQDVLEAFDEDNFRHEAPIASYSFGTPASGTQLSHHHSLAQQIIADTLDGINDDIAAFVSNVTKSAQILLDIDGTSAADLKKRTAVLEQFDYLQHHSRGESNNQETRNDLENGGA